METQEDYSLLGCKNKQELKEYLIKYNIYKETINNVEADALYIYMKYGKPLLEKILKRDIKLIEGKAYLFETISSKELKTKVSKDAHKKKPINIKIGISSVGFYYMPRDKYIFISPNRQVVELTLSNSPDELEEIIPQSVKKRFNLELKKDSYTQFKKYFSNGE